MSDTQSDPPRRRMQLVAEQQLPDPPASPAASQPSPTIPRTLPPEIRQELQARAAWRQGVIGSLNVAAQILAVRLILLVSVVGAIALAWIAAQEHDPYRLASAGVYTITVVLPLVWLSSRR